MSLTNEQYEKISRFLNLEMDETEMDAFEKELNTNPEMRHQLDFEQSLRDDFAVHNVTSLPNTTPVPATTGKLKGIRKWLAISAAVITACILFSILWQKPSKKPAIVNREDMDTTQKTINQVIAITPAKDSSKVIDLLQLFNQYFKKDAIPQHYPMYLAEALTNYEAGNYATLQKLSLNNLPQTRSISETDSKENILTWGHYYKGLAFLQTGNTKEAAINLDWVLNNQPGKALKAKAQWYLALTYLKENNKEKAVELCNSIIQHKENQLLIENAKKILDIVGR
ncbi:MAG: tetratricopeptide repeat protein [Agriterribacter sp.]